MKIYKFIEWAFFAAALMSGLASISFGTGPLLYSILFIVAAIYMKE